MKFSLISLATLLLGSTAVLAAPLTRRALPLPADHQGKFVMFVEVIATPGREDELGELPHDIQVQANDPELEPETLTYRLARGFGEESNKYWILEEYLEPSSLAYHQSTPVFLAMKNSGAIDVATENYAGEIPV
ncbi:hypothetical protein V5O48_013811 [Marasmius crinis-equi]|uniref:ABM domain-containing protein n=1 Tax=Marasmius crinis-equi TaxID=585013 RepID=A0ABR3EZ15_9AGAR